jgi:cellulose 1,4-beta-cellobiosidase
LVAPVSTLQEAPTNVTATVSSGQITVSWSAAQGASYYNIYWSDQSDVGIGSSRISGVSSTTYTFANLSDGQLYYFVVTAVSSSGVESQVSYVVSASPTISPPTSVTVKAESGTVTLSWEGAISATSYNVYWSNASPVSLTTANRTSGITDITTTLSSLSNNTSYYYIVTAVNSLGESAASAQVGASLTTHTSGSPSWVSLTISSSGATLAWESLSGASSYNVYWNNTGSVATTDSHDSAGSTASYTATGLTSGTAYYYAVTAVSSSVESGTSLGVSVIP